MATSTKKRVKLPTPGGRLPITPENPFGLNEMAQLFVIEYTRDFNAERAALAAGYTPLSAANYAWKMLRRPEVQAALSASCEARRQRVAAKLSNTQLKADRVLLEVARISFSDIRQLFTEEGLFKPVQEWTDDMAAAVAKIESDEILEYDPITKEKVFVGYTRKVTLYDKNSALEKCMKHLGQYEQDNLQKQMKMDGETATLVAVRKRLAQVFADSRLAQPVDKAPAAE